MAKFQMAVFNRYCTCTGIVSLLAGMLLSSNGGCTKKEEATSTTSPASNTSPAVAAELPFPALPAARMIGGDIEFYVIRIDGTGPGRPMELDLYIPRGRHQPKSLPCVLIAPSATGNHGSLIDEGDRAEHYPYVRAGFAVMAYELSGALADAHTKKHTYAEIMGPVKQFVDADGGLANGRIAIDFVLQRVPQIDPDRLFACGHSSAAVVALNLARGDTRIRGCCAYAPCTDVETWWNDPKMEHYVPGFGAFATRKSPLRHVDAIDCPVYLFHADDDSMVPLADNQKFTEAMNSAGKQIVFERVAVGGHIDSMFNEGIPKGIKFMESMGAKPLTPISDTAK
jgi:dienelactone hydrolase